MYSENDEPLISVMIPIYNSEKYIGRCIESVIKQSYKNLEIILIDDGSTDNSGKICDKYGKKDNRIKVFHEKNSGVAASRNKALDLAGGKYLIFVDSDDFIFPEMIEILHDDIEEYDTQMAVSDYIEGNGNDFSYEDLSGQLEILFGEEKYRKLFDENKLSFIVPWGRLYKRELFNGLRYPNGKIHEDEYIAHYILERAESISYSRSKFYYYFKEDEGDSSITQSYFSMKRLDCIGALEDRLDFFKKLGNRDLLTLAYDDFLKRFQYYYYGVKYQFSDKNDLAEELFGRYKELYKEGKKYLSFPKKIRYGLFIYMPTVNFYLKKLFKSKSVKR